jgi:hypothetical protein
MWLYIPKSPDYPYARELADLMRDSALPLEMPSELSVTLRSKPLQPRHWRRICKAARFLNLLSGIRLNPSQAQCFAEQFLSSLPASPASRSVARVSRGASKTSATSGPTSPESFERLSLSWYSWKTSQLCSQPELPMEDLPIRSWKPIYRRWVTQLRREYSARLRLGQATGESGYSYWPTATASEDKQTEIFRRGNLTLKGAAQQWPTPNALVSNDGETPETWRARAESLKEKGYNGNGAGMPLAIASQLWGTPRVGNNHGSGNNRADPKRRLEDQAFMWATPASRDFRAGDASEETLNKNARPLNEQATNWPTPRASMSQNRDTKAAPSYGLTHGRSLAGEAAQWPTPTALSFKDSHQPGNDAPQNRIIEIAESWSTPRASDGAKGGPNQQQKGTAPLATQACRISPLDPQTRDGQQSLKPARGSRPQLNADFVEWLQGMPAHWTRGSIDLESLEIWRYRSRLLLRSLCSRFVSD